MTSRDGRVIIRGLRQSTGNPKWEEDPFTKKTLVFPDNGRMWNFESRTSYEP